MDEIEVNMKLKYQFIIMFIPIISFFIIIPIWIKEQAKSGIPFLKSFIKFAFMACSLLLISKIGEFLHGSSDNEVFRFIVNYSFLYFQSIIISVLAVLDQKRMIDENNTD